MAAYLCRVMCKKKKKKKTFKAVKIVAWYSRKRGQLSQSKLRERSKFSGIVSSAVL